MTRKTTPSQRSDARRNATVTNRRRSIVRQIFHESFVHSVRSSRMTKAQVARELRITPATVHNWLRGDHRIDLETLAMSLRLWPHFLRCLVVIERKAKVI